MECMHTSMTNGIIQELYEDFRHVQKITEKDIASPMILIPELCKKVSSQNADSVEWPKVLSNLDKVRDRLIRIKTNLEEDKAHSDACCTTLSKRLDFLSGEQSNELISNYLIADFLSRKGWIQSANKVASLYDQTELIDQSHFAVLEKIVFAIKIEHSVDHAFQWCATHKALLKKHNSALELQLHKFAFIRVVEGGNVIDSIQYAKKHLAPYTADHMEDIQRTFSCLAFSPISTSASMNDVSKKRKHNNTTTAKFLSQKDWDTLASYFEFEYKRILSMDMHSPFELCVKAGLSALKTRHCYPAQRENVKSILERVTLDCPCCDNVLGTIALDLPKRNSQRSAVLCRQSGQIMDEFNPPLALPNGHVFSEQSLRNTMGSNKDQKVVCSETGQNYDWKELKRVFLV